MREAKGGGDLEEDIRKRETPASVVAQPAPAANKGLRVEERSAAEMSRV